MRRALFVRHRIIMPFKTIVFDSIDSTNSYVKSQFGELNDRTIIRARFQTSGRGRFDRVWQSLPNENLLISLLFKQSVTASFVHEAECAIVDILIGILNDYGIRAIKKEPNDIYVAGKKIAGLLIETKQTGGLYDYLVIGIGLNVLQRAFDDGLNATSMALESASVLNVERVYAALVERISSYFED